MGSVPAARQANNQQQARRTKHPPLTLEELARVYDYVLCRAVDKKTQDLRVRYLAQLWLFPNGSLKSQDADGALYGRFTYARRPWPTADALVLFVVLNQLKLDPETQLLACALSLERLAACSGLDYSTAQRALARLRNHQFPVLKCQLAGVTFMEGRGRRKHACYRFELVIEPLVFAAQRDKARAENRADAERKLKDLSADRTRYNEAAKRQLNGEITEDELRAEVVRFNAETRRQARGRLPARAF